MIISQIYSSNSLYKVIIFILKGHFSLGNIYSIENKYNNNHFLPSTYAVVLVRVPLYASTRKRKQMKYEINYKNDNIKYYKYKKLKTVENFMYKNIAKI